MQRRTVITGGILFVAGCSSSFRGSGENETPGVIEGILLEEVPVDADVTLSDDERLVDVKVIQELVRKATNSAERTTVQRNGEEYEMVTLELQSPERSAERMCDARDAIDTLRDETGGSYVSHDSVILELGYVVPA